MIQKVTLMKSGLTDDVPFKYILSGNEEASTLAVLVSGMLYDFNKPLPGFIFVKLKQRIANNALSLEVEQMDSRLEDVYIKKEISVYSQSKRIKNSISDVLRRYPKIKNIIYVAHSMGSVVLYDMLNHQSSFERELNSSCFLLAPVPFGIKIDELAKNTTESLLTKDIDRSAQLNNVYIERDNSRVEINDEIWQCLGEITKDYGNNLSQFSRFDKKDALNIFVAKNDSVFTNDINSIKDRYPNSKVQILDATHSFKDITASGIIIDEIYSKIIDKK